MTLYDKCPICDAPPTLCECVKMPAIACNNCVTRYQELLTNILQIVHESVGVAGWHKNGDVALWSEFEDIAAAEKLLGMTLELEIERSRRNCDNGDTCPGVFFGCENCDDWTPKP